MHFIYQILRNMKTLKVLFLGLAVLLVSCSKDDDDNNNTPTTAREYNLYIDFWNPDGNNPQIQFDAQNSSKEVRIDFSQTFAGVAVPPNFTNVIIDNVRIIDANYNNYQIDGITAYEFREDINGWKVDVEFYMAYEPVGHMDVVLVLDASASLGNDFGKVKEFANSFVSKVFTQSPGANIGIVDFSDVINTYTLSNDQEGINDYILGIEQGPFTTLYEALNEGITMLQENEAEGKAIVTFTDGTDNNSGPQYTPQFLADRMENDPDNILINSFTIGLEGNGGVDKPVLEKLAVNGGVAAFPRNIGELETVFDQFSTSIANVYNLTYIRNQQVIPQGDAVKLKFVIKASPK